MITELAIVSKLESGAAWVRTRRQSVCGACKAKSGCGQEVLQRLGQNWAEIKIQIPSESLSEVAVGDTVEIGIDERAVLIASLLAYGVPIIGLLLGVLAASASDSRLLTVAAAAAGLYLGAIAVQRWTRSQRSSAYEPVLVAVRPMSVERPRH